MRYLVCFFLAISAFACKKPFVDARSSTQSSAVETQGDDQADKVLGDVDDANALLAMPTYCMMESVDGKDCLVCSPRGFKLRECFVAPVGFQMAENCKPVGLADADQKIICEKDGKNIAELSLKKRNVEEAADSIGFVSAMGRVVIKTKIKDEKPEKAMALELMDLLDANLGKFLQGDGDAESLIANIEAVILKHKPTYSGEKSAKIKSAMTQGLQDIQGMIKTDNINMAALLALYAKLGAELPSTESGKLFSLEDLTKLLSSADDKTLDMIREQLSK